MEEEKSYYVTTADMSKINSDIDFVLVEIEKLKDNLGEVFKVIEELEPQQKLFFLDKFIMDLVMKSKMPTFYLTGLLTKMSDNLKIMGERDPPKEEKKYFPSYLG